MKTIREKYLEWVGDQSKRIPNDPRDWGQIVFEVGYELAQKEMEERVNSAAEKYLDIAGKYSAAVNKIIEMKERLEEAVEVMKLMSDDLENEGIDHYDGGKAYQKFLKSQSEISK